MCIHFEMCLSLLSVTDTTILLQKQEPFQHFRLLNPHEPFPECSMHCRKQSCDNKLMQKKLFDKAQHCMFNSSSLFWSDLYDCRILVSCVPLLLGLHLLQPEELLTL